MVMPPGLVGTPVDTAQAKRQAEPCTAQSVQLFNDSLDLASRTSLADGDDALVDRPASEPGVAMLNPDWPLLNGSGSQEGLEAQWRASTAFAEESVNVVGAVDRAVRRSQEVALPAARRPWRMECTVVGGPLEGSLFVSDSSTSGADIHVHMPPDVWSVFARQRQAVLMQLPLAVRARLHFAPAAAPTCPPVIDDEQP